jgi:hypothetical protein
VANVNDHVIYLEDIISETVQNLDSIHRITQLFKQSTSIFIFFINTPELIKLDFGVVFTYLVNVVLQDVKST